MDVSSRMDVKNLIEQVNGKLLNESADLLREVRGGFAADLMSDVLASVQPEAILITGLCNPQVIRTALMADVSAILLVRGKKPQAETLALAQQERIPLISTPLGMYQVCGQLFGNGLPSFEDDIVTRLNDYTED
jgi:predicted transcriptional regulator